MFVGKNVVLPFSSYLLKARFFCTDIFRAASAAYLSAGYGVEPPHLQPKTVSGTGRANNEKSCRSLNGFYACIAVCLAKTLID